MNTVQFCELILGRPLPAWQHAVIEHFDEERKMTISLKITAASVAAGQQARVQVVGNPSDATEQWIIADTTTEVTVNLYGNRRLVVIEEPVPAAAAEPTKKEIGDTTTGTATVAPATTGGTPAAS
jgi:hypothetical protein